MHCKLFLANLLILPLPTTGVELADLLRFTSECRGDMVEVTTVEPPTTLATSSRSVEEVLYAGIREVLDLRRMLEDEKGNGLGVTLSEGYADDGSNIMTAKTQAGDFDFESERMTARDLHTGSHPTDSDTLSEHIPASGTHLLLNPPIHRPDPPPYTDDVLKPRASLTEDNREEKDSPIADPESHTDPLPIPPTTTTATTTTTVYPPIIHPLKRLPTQATASPPSTSPAPSSTPTPPPTACQPPCSSLLTQWIETWLDGTSRTWVPVTMTLHFPGVTGPVAKPVEGRIGLGTLKGEVGVTRTVWVLASGGERIEVVWMVVGMGMVVMMMGFGWW